VLATLLETDMEDPMVEKVYEKARLVPTCSTFRDIFCSKFPIRFTPSEHKFCERKLREVRATHFYVDMDAERV
jgi:hypothetical protein